MPRANGWRINAVTSLNFDGFAPHSQPPFFVAPSRMTHAVSDPSRCNTYRPAVDGTELSPPFNDVFLRSAWIPSMGWW